MTHINEIRTQPVSVCLSPARRLQKALRLRLLWAKRADGSTRVLDGESLEIYRTASKACWAAVSDDSDARGRFEKSPRSALRA